MLLRERMAPACVRRFKLPVDLDDTASQAKPSDGVRTATPVKKARPTTRVQVR